jgi:methionine synthase II (cobalamin-independent)
MPEKLFPTTVVGSYPQPDWLVDRKMLSKVVPRIRMKESAQPKIDLGVLADLAPKNVMLGVLDLSDLTVETPQTVAARIRRGLEHLPAERLIPAAGADIVRRELS